MNKTVKTVSTGATAIAVGALLSISAVAPAVALDEFPADSVSESVKEPVIIGYTENGTPIYDYGDENTAPVETPEDSATVAPEPTTEETPVVEETPEPTTVETPVESVPENDSVTAPAAEESPTDPRIIGYTENGTPIYDYGDENTTPVETPEDNATVAPVPPTEPSNVPQVPVVEQAPVTSPITEATTSPVDNTTATDPIDNVAFENPGDLANRNNDGYVVAQDSNTGTANSMNSNIQGLIASLLASIVGIIALNSRKVSSLLANVKK